MNGYALAHLHSQSSHDDVLEYLERIQGTLDPFGGRFLVHGPPVEVREGEWPGTVVIIEFPSLDAARSWYDSPAYQAIRHLRTDHIAGSAILFEGVRDGHDPAKMAAAIRAAR
ncbi:DUF1330 domain-containing protein [Dactylosporangium sp. NPDC000244]|uniref:DUF1330 domain-containing protein n=1 Tax=Dactylosporangium sp. NPDC000244 TaxID=3154365 RepID=UPI003321F1A8